MAGRTGDAKPGMARSTDCLRISERRRSRPTESHRHALFFERVLYETESHLQGNLPHRDQNESIKFQSVPAMARRDRVGQFQMRAPGCSLAHSSCVKAYGGL